MFDLITVLMVLFVSMQITIQNSDIKILITRIKALEASFEDYDEDELEDKDAKTGHK